MTLHNYFYILKKYLSIWSLQEINFTIGMRGLVIKFPCSRGDSGALYPQSATEGVMAGFGLSSCEAALGKWR